MTSVGIGVLETETQLRVFELDFRSDSRWEQFISSHPDAFIYHHPDWLIALEEEYEAKCISLACEDESHQLRGILPLFGTKGLPFRLGRHATNSRLSSLPRTPVAGPLTLDDDAARELTSYAVQLARSLSGTQLEIKTQVAGLDDSVEDLSCLPWRPTYVDELPSAVDRKPWKKFWENVRLPRNCGPCKGCRRLRFGNAKQQHRVNWAVNKAMKLGLEVREADSEQDLEKWYALYLETMRHNAIPPRSYRFFLSLWSSMQPKGRLRLLVAEQELNGSKRMIAGSILLKYGQTVFYAFTGCVPEDLCLHPHDLIQIESIREACKGGFRWYDFGEVAEDHEALAQFKKKWGAEPRPQYRYYSPAIAENASSAGSVSTSIARRIWRRLPVRATQTLGDLIYRYL